MSACVCPCIRVATSSGVDLTCLCADLTGFLSSLASPVCACALFPRATAAAAADEIFAKAATILDDRVENVHRQFQDISLRLAAVSVSFANSVSLFVYRVCVVV